MRFFVFQSDDRRSDIINGTIMKNGRRISMRIDNVRLGIVIGSAVEHRRQSRADRKIDSERFAYLIARIC